MFEKPAGKKTSSEPSEQLFIKQKYKTNNPVSLKKTKHITLLLFLQDHS